MAKFHQITGVIAWVFIIILMFVLIHPFDLQENWEKTYHSNEGLIWMIGIVGVATANLFLYLNGIVQRENKKCIEENMRKNTTISVQNEQIIKNQLKYIHSLDTLNERIAENTKKDIETLGVIQTQSDLIKTNSNSIKKIEHTMVTIEKAIQRIEDYNGHSEKRLDSIERLIKIHDKEISTLKK